MLNLNSIMIGSSQPKELAEFYKKILNLEPSMVDGDWTGWQVGACFLTIGSHSEVKDKSKEPARIMLVLETKEVKSEFERMKNSGATVIKEPYSLNADGSEGGDYWIATLADPDGNYFQLMMPWDISDMEKNA